MYGGDFGKYINLPVLFWSSPDGRTDKQSENDAYNEPTIQVAGVGLENCPVGPWPALSQIYPN